MMKRAIKPTFSYTEAICINISNKSFSQALYAQGKERTGLRGEDKTAGKFQSEKVTVALSCKAIPGVQSKVKRTGHIEDAWAI